MKRILENNNNAILTTWETDPKLRNNSIITFYEYQDKPTQPGDHIITRFSADGVSLYTVSKILDRKQGQKKGKHFVRAQVSWQNTMKGINLNQLDHKNTSIKFKQFFSC